MIRAHQLFEPQGFIASALFRHRKVLAMLPRQEGKTELGVRFSREIIAHPSEVRQALMLAKSRDSLKRMSREKILRIFGEEVFKGDTIKVINRLNPASTLWLESVDKRPDKIRGGTYHYIHWPEVAFSEFDFGVTAMQIFNRVVAPTTRQTNGYVFMESTPNGPNGWKDIWDQAKELGFVRIKMPLSLLVELGVRSQEEFGRLRKNMARLEFLQEYECEFVTFQGLVFEELLEHHIWEEMPGPKEHHRVGFAIDWGWNPSATCVLFAYLLHGRMCIFDEIYGKELRLDQTEALIKDKLNAWQVSRGMASGVGDHDPLRIDAMVRAGLQVGECSKTDVLGARMDIKTLLAQDKLYIHPRCKNLLRDLQTAPWDLKKHGEIDYKKCPDGHFDGEAAARYLVRMFRNMHQDEPFLVRPGLDENSLREFLRCQ